MRYLCNRIGKIAHMADNYLEKKMEEHRAGTRRMFKDSRKKSRAVFITDGLSDEGRRTIASLTAEGDCRIAFASTDSKEGSRLAQATGSRFYCLTARLTLGDAIADAAARFAPLPLSVISSTHS